jgi:hypothetical protein
MVDDNIMKQFADPKFERYIVSLAHYNVWFINVREQARAELCQAQA